MIAVATPNYLERDDSGVVWVAGTNRKVVEIVLDHLGHGWSADQIHEQHPDLPLARIHAALAYYYENPAEIEAEIERRQRYSAELKAELVISAAQRRLRVLAQKHCDLRE